MPKYKTDEQSKKVMSAALKHYHNCGVCQLSKSYADIGTGERGCPEGMRLWNLAMLEFIRLHPKYKEAWYELYKGKAN